MGFWLGYAAGKAAADLVRDELGDSAGRSSNEGYLLPDEVARQEACRRLNASSEVDAKDVDVSVLSGELTLRGRVPEEQMKAHAGALCADVPGVTRARNELSVG